MPKAAIQDQGTLAQFILYVVYQLNDLGRFPSSIQIVKYLYLIDVEFQRVMRTQLTPLEWRFHLYGPYAFELPALMARLGYHMAAEQFDGEEGQGWRHRAEVEVKFPQEIAPIAQTIADRVLKVWGLASTREILDHVYFGTEPMEDAVRGEPLDFSRVRPDLGAFEVEFRDSKRLRELRKRHDKPLVGEDRVSRVLTPPEDDLFFREMDRLDRQ